jgi:LmbE family N-acetylglucosaminyl deacetylase
MLNLGKFKKTVVILAPHVDDGEFGCGGTIARLVDEGHNLYYLAFSYAKKSIPEGMKDSVTRLEFVEAMKELGIINYTCFNFPVRDFWSHRQAILESMIEFRHKANPDVVFMPSSFDTHQDHEVIHNEGFRAFKRSTILGYEMPRNNLEFKTSTYITLDEAHMERKRSALSKYKSQMVRSGDMHMWDLVDHLARTRGLQINEQYAEAFETIRMIV